MNWEPMFSAFLVTSGGKRNLTWHDIVLEEKVKRKKVKDVSVLN
jgi:hypothetical protein